jgi:hypothetical protein
MEIWAEDIDLIVWATVCCKRVSFSLDSSQRCNMYSSFPRTLVALKIAVIICSSNQFRDLHTIIKSWRKAMNLQIGIANKLGLAPTACFDIIPAFAMTIIFIANCQQTKLGRIPEDLSPSLMALPRLDQA